MMLVVGLPGVVFYIVLVPAGTFAILYQRRRIFQNKAQHPP